MFNHKALAKVSRAKLLEVIQEESLALPDRYPVNWVVDVKSVGSGDKALVYLGRNIQILTVASCNADSSA